VGRYVDADLGRIRHQSHAEGATQMKHLIIVVRDTETCP
jgi:hypothetical protein